MNTLSLQVCKYIKYMQFCIVCGSPMWKYICDALAHERQVAVALRSDLIFTLTVTEQSTRQSVNIIRECALLR